MKKRRIILLAGFAVFCILSACGPDERGETPPAPSGSVQVSPAPESAPPAPESDPPASEPPASSGPAVYTDWSRLGPYEPSRLLCRRWYEEPVHELRPLDGGYGTLVPFVGSFPPDLSWGGVYEYGLMTMDGTIVVDSTYSDVSRLGYREGGETTRLPVLALMTTEPQTDEEGWPRGIQRFGAAALDGSWSIPPEYDGIGVFSADGFYLWKDKTVFVYGTDGQFRRDISFSNTEWPWLGEWEYEMRCGGGFLVEQDGTTLWLVELSTGTRTPVEDISEVREYGNGLFIVRPAESGLWGCINTVGEWVIPAKYEELWMAGDAPGMLSAYTGGEVLYVDMAGNEYRENPRGPVEEGAWDYWIEPVEDSYTGEIWYLHSLYPEDKPGYLIKDGDGNLLGNTLVSNDAGSQCRCVVNGLFLNIDGETAGYKDRDGNWVFRIPLAEAGD